MTAALTAAAIVAGIDWWAVARDHPRIEAVAKPAVMVLLIVAALSSESTGFTVWAIVAALGLSLLGDVLLLPAVDQFIRGLVAFLLAHVAYLVAFASLEIRYSAAVIAVIVMAAVAFVVTRRLTSGPTHAIGVYAAVLCALVGLAVGTGNTWIILGSGLFAASDGVLAWNRFAHPLPYGRVVTHVMYHCGQALIVIGATT